MPKTTRKNDSENHFVHGRADHLRLGGYGGTVLLWSTHGVLRIRSSGVNREGRKQKTLGPDTAYNRAHAARIAREVHAALRQKAEPGMSRHPAAAEGAAEGGHLTIGRILQEYLSDSCPLAPRTALFTWRRPHVREHLNGLTPELRAGKAKAPATINKILVSSRRLFNHPLFRPERSVDDLELADFDQYAQDLMGAGLTADTAMTHLGVLRAAIRHFMVMRRKTWGDRKDPTTAAWAKLPTPKGRRPGFTEREVAAVLLAAHRSADWRLFGVLLIIAGTGRRVGAIGADQGDNYLDAPPLLGRDVIERPSGELGLRFRADVAKGHAYGGGDTIVALPHSITPRFRDLLRRYPNPLGPDHPVFWHADDPSSPVPHHQLLRSFKAAWAAAFPGCERPKHRAFHCFSKATITELANLLGAETAGDYTGKTPKTVNEHYRDRRAADMARASSHVSESLRQTLPSEVLTPREGEDS